MTTNGELALEQAVKLDNGFLIFILAGDVTVNFETSNGHTITISEETIQEENVIKTTEDNGSLSANASAVEGKKEDKKGKQTNPHILTNLYGS